jgi:hypothetical protein
MRTPREKAGTMNTYTIKYEAGALAITVQAVGTDIHDAIRSLGFKDSDTFMAMRVITWAKNDGAPLAPDRNR